MRLFKMKIAEKQWQKKSRHLKKTKLGHLWTYHQVRNLFTANRYIDLSITPTDLLNDMRQDLSFEEINR